MMNARNLFLSITAAALLLAAARAEQSEPAGGRLTRLTDPAEALLLGPLTPKDEERLKALFGKLEADDFDERQRAEKAILAFGPRAIPVAQKHLNDASFEVRDFSKRFSTEVLLRFRGYLPVSPALRAKLAVPHRYFIGKNETLREAVDRAFRDSGIEAAYHMATFPDRTVGTQETTEITLPAGEAINRLMDTVEMQVIPRGDGLVVVPKEGDIPAFKQEHNFEIGEALRAQSSALLSKWLPAGTTATVVGDGVRVSGTERDLRLAARALFCLSLIELDAASLPADAAFPPVSDGSLLNDLLTVLNKPVREFRCGGTAAGTAVVRLREQGHPLAFEDQCGAVRSYDAAISLHLVDVPLGLALQWMVWRSQVPAESELPRSSVRIGTEEFLPHAPIVGQTAAPHAPVIWVRKVCNTAAQASAETVGCWDIGFLYAKPNGPQNDADAAKSVERALTDELSLLPHGTEEFAVAVFHKRLLLRGSAQAISLARRLIADWRSTGNEPKPAWREKIDAALAKEYDWGRSWPLARSIDSAPARTGRCERDA